MVALSEVVHVRLDLVEVSETVADHLPEDIDGEADEALAEIVFTCELTD